MRDRPDVRYAHNGDVAIAYQVFGQGPADLVCIPGFISNLYWNWELPDFSRMLTGLGSFARVAILDRRGVGLSDRLSPQDLPPLEVVMDDIITVMDEAGIDRAAVWRSTSAPGSARSPAPGRCWSAPRSKTSPRARGWCSKTLASTS